MSWDRTIPNGSTTSPCASTVQITGNFSAIENWWGIEHYTFSSALSGRHKPGISSTILTATKAVINALTSPGTGALAYDNSCGVLRIYKSSNTWDPITKDHFSRLKLTSTGHSIAATAWTEIIFDTEVYDGISEWAAGTSTLRPIAAGYYFIESMVTYPSTGGNYERAVGFYVDGTRYVQAGGYGDIQISIECDDVIYVPAGSLVQVFAYNGNNTAITFTSASLTLTRLS